MAQNTIAGLDEKQRSNLEGLVRRARLRNYPPEVQSAVSMVGYVKPDGVTFEDPSRDYDWLEKSCPDTTPEDLRGIVHKLAVEPVYREQMEQKYRDLKINHLKIVGFDGYPIGSIGLCTPIAEHPDIDGLYGKIGTDSFYGINRRRLKEYAEEGFITKLPKYKNVVPDDDWQKTPIVVGFADVLLLILLNQVGDKGIIDFKYDGRTINCAYSTEEGIVKRRFNVDSLNLEGADKCYWIGKIDEEEAALSNWSYGLCEHFDDEFRANAKRIKGINPETLHEYMEGLSEIAWNATACAWSDKQALKAAQIRVHVTLIGEDSKEIRRRFESGSRLLLPKETWKHFYPLVQAKYKALMERR